jgi:hypothetical protein
MTRSRQIEFLDNPVLQETNAAALGAPVVASVATSAAPTAHTHEIVTPTNISESLSIHPTPAEAETERSISSHGTETVTVGDTLQTELTHSTDNSTESGSSVTEQTPVSDSVAMKVTRKKKSE